MLCTSRADLDLSPSSSARRKCSKAVLIGAGRVSLEEVMRMATSSMSMKGPPRNNMTMAHAMRQQNGWGGD